MKHRLYVVFVLFVLLPVVNLSGQEVDGVSETHCNTYESIRDNYSDELLNSFFPFVQYHQNKIEWYQAHAMADFFNLLRNCESRKIRILHIGDSHIHSDIFTGYVRKRLQIIFGSAGRGIVFPYCTAGTHATRDYKTMCQGVWTSAKTTERELIYDIGITGVTARTEDVKATASIIFRPAVFAHAKILTSITLLCKPGEDIFDVNIRSGNNEWTLKSVDQEKGVMKGEIEWDSDTLTLSFSAADSVQKFFELYGIILEYKHKPGIIYSSAGINGAALQDLTGQKLLENHIAVLNPDLIVLDLGTNDIYRGIFDESVLHKLLTTILQRMKIAAPNASFLLIPPQDMYYRKKHVVNTELFAALLRKVAIEQNCALYDFFTVSGGNYSMLNWEKNLLAKKDRLHLTTEGYELKGKLFVLAILEAYERYLDDMTIVTEITAVEPDSACVAMLFKDPKMYGGKTIPVEKPVTSVPPVQKPPTGGNVTHVVKSGENLGFIAQKYGVTVSQIQQWNNLSGTTIYPGQKLVIYGKNAQTTTKPAETKKPTTDNSTTAGSKVIYTVKSGDSLYAISKKYGVTVENIKKWNKLTSDKIQPGQKLTIYQ